MKTILAISFVAGLALAAPASAATVTFGGTGIPDAGVIETFLPGFGDTGPVDIRWSPLADANLDALAQSTLTIWNAGYSGQAAAICNGGFGAACTFDLLVAPGWSVSLDRLSFGSFVSSQTITYSVLDLGTSSELASGAPTVENTTPTDVFFTAASVTSTTGLRILFDDEFNTNGGLTALGFSFAQVQTGPGPDPDPAPGAIPLPAAGWLLIAGLGGLAALRRRG